MDSSEGDRLYPLWVTAYFTGKRQSEVLGATWENVDLAARVWLLRERLGRENGRWKLRPPKTEATVHFVPLAPVVVDALSAWRKVQAAEAAEFGKVPTLVFTTRDGRPWHGSYLLRAWHKALAAANLPIIRFHDIRHSTASGALGSGGATLEDMKQLLGHSTIKVTSDTYVHPLTSRQREVVAALEAAVTRSRTRSRTESSVAHSRVV